MVELFEYRRKYGVLKEKVRIISLKMPLDDDVLYTEKTCFSEWISWRIRSHTDCPLGDGGRGTITMTFAYSPGGNDDLLYIGYP